MPLALAHEAMLARLRFLPQAYAKRECRCRSAMNDMAAV